MRKVLFYFLLLFLLLCGSVWLVLHSEAFWRWAGHNLIVAANNQVQGELTVQEIEGTPFKGYVFKGIKLTTPEGEVFRAKGFLFRLSLRSIVRLEPVVDKLTLYEPVLILDQDRQGQWNVSRLLTPRKEPPSQVSLPFKSLIFSQIRIENGVVQIRQPGGSQRFEDLDVDANLAVSQPLSPQMRLELGKSRLAATTPWGRYNLETRLNYSENQLKLASLVLATDSQRLLSLSGNLALDKNGTTSMSGDIGPVPPALLARFYDKWPSAWKLTGKFQMQGKPSDLQFALGTQIHEATLDLTGHLALAGKPTGYDVKLKLANVNAEMLSILDVPGGEVYRESSPLSANLHLQGSGLAWPPPEFSWQLQVEPFTLRTARMEKFQIKAAGSAARQTLEGVLCGNFGSLSLISQGSFFIAPQGDIKLRVVDFEPGLLGLKAAPESYVSADFDGKFSLPELKRPDSLMVEGEVKASGCLEGYPLEELWGRFNWEKPKLTLQTVQAKVGNVAAELRGTLDGDRLDFTTQGKTLPGGNWPVPDTLKGGLTWTGTLQGTVSEPRYNLQAQGQGLAVGSVALQSFTLRAQGLGLPPRTGALDLKATAVKTPTGTFQQVTVKADGEGNRWRYQFHASSPPAGPMVEVAGNVDLPEPSYSLQAKGQNLTVGSVGVQSFTLKVQGVDLPPRTGALDLKAAGVKTPAGTFQQVTLRADGEGNRWRYQFNGTSPPPGPLAELVGNVDLGSRPMSLVVDRLNLKMTGISVQNRGQVRARFLPGLDLPTTAFNVNGGAVQVVARIQDDQVSARLEVRQLPLKNDKIKGLQGTLQSQITLSGSPRNPVLEGGFNLTSVQWQNYSVKPISIVTALSYRGGVLKISGKVKEGLEGVRLSWEGKMPLQLSLMPFQFNLPESGLDFAVNSEGANLKLLEPFVTEISSADLPIDLDVRIKGSWRQPEVKANIRWQQGYFTLRQAGIPYTIAPGTINWQGNKLSLPQLILESGGTVRLAGSVDFKGYQPQTVRARADIDNFKVLERVASKVFLSGEVNLNGPFSALVLRGRLFIPDATINPALIRPSTRQHPDIVLVRQKQPRKAEAEQSLEAKPDFYRNMKIDLSLEAPDNIWIKQKTPQVKADVELNLDVRLSKKPGEPLAIGGMVRSREGNLNVFNKEFKVDKAVVTLPGVPDRQPVIEARASHEMTDATLLVDVSGPVNKPQIELSSSPPMPSNDLMSYLVFGRPAGDLSQQEFNAEQQAVGVLGGITASKIQELLGDDFPILGDVTVKSTAGSLGLTKTLAKGVNISVERRTSPTAREDPTTVRLEYRINRHLRLQAEQGQRNTGGDVLFKYDF